MAGRLLGHAGKRRIGLLAESFWSAAFAAAGLFVQRRSIDWSHPDPQQTVLVIAPHPDDESIGCAGTLLLHKRRGSRVIVACITDGRTSRAFGLGPDEMAARRRCEAENCARLLAVDALEWAGLRGGDWTESQLLGVLDELTARYRPDLVYAPSCVDFHPEHRDVAHVLAGFWQSASLRPFSVRVYPIQVPLTPKLANLIVDVSSEMARAREAMETYTTQFANIPRAIRQRRYAAQCYRVGSYAEEFWQMSVPDYIRLHLDYLLHREQQFRGVREHPISDPLAYLVGQKARERLARETWRRASSTSR
jgi:LmbE family N-acetylglucosaminyl deacetylase